MFTYPVSLDKGGLNGHTADLKSNGNQDLTFLKL